MPVTRLVPNRLVNAAQKRFSTWSSSPSSMARATSNRAYVDAPMVTIGRLHTAHATFTRAMSPMWDMKSLNGLSCWKMDMWGSFAWVVGRWSVGRVGRSDVCRGVQMVGAVNQALSPRK